ncbi:hypothetical protein [Pseudonocardia nigra]|uniref:hypothetical protein n=1 Tax=Pseudonocardia nigra TaxID=1921578 RepID=UPI001C5E5EE3|nr:hypothetical protein [Pseudonocardia nigra]
MSDPVMIPFDPSARRLTTRKGIDTEELTGRTFPYQFDRALVDDVDLMAATPGEDLNWLEDIHMMEEDGMNAVFDRYTNAFLKIYFDVPAGREDEYARKVLIMHLQEGNSYGIWLKHKHAKYPQPELGPWLSDSATVGENYTAPELEGWEKSLH